MFSLYGKKGSELCHRYKNGDPKPAWNLRQWITTGVTMVSRNMLCIKETVKKYPCLISKYKYTLNVSIYTCKGCRMYILSDVTMVFHTLDKTSVLYVHVNIPLNNWYEF